MSEITYNQILSKLDRFIRKYYVNELLKGLLLFIGFGLILYLSVVGLEALGKFGSVTRTILFYLFVIGFIGIFGQYVIRPVLKLSNIGRRLTHKQAAAILGKHFPEVRDRLLNTIQLTESTQATDNSLLLASIDSRVRQLSPVPFVNAVDLKSNRRYLKYVLPPLLVLIALIVIDVNWIKDPTERLLNYQEAYTPPAPYHIELLNDDLNVVANEPIRLKVRIEGQEAPSSISMVQDGRRYRMKKLSKTEFEYTIRIDKPGTIYFTTGEVSSKRYSFNVLPRPKIQKFEIELLYPEYTGRQNETLQGVGDLDVPEGTKARWVFNTENVQTLGFHGEMMDTSLNVGMDQYAELSRTLTEDEQYAILMKNQFLSHKDSSNYLIQVRKDQYPSIDLQEEEDSLNPKMKYFNGNVQDDYGFSSLSFVISYKNGSNKGKTDVYPVSLNGGSTNESFMHFWNFNNLKLNPGEEVSYYFVVKDNDGFNGPKSSKSSSYIYRMPSLKELEDKYDENSTTTADEMNKALKEASDIRKKMKEMENELSNSPNMSWQQKQKMESLLNRQESLQKKLEKIQDNVKKNNEEKEEFTEQEEDLLKKKEQLEKLMDELLTPEMKKMLEEMRRLMEQFNKEQLQDKLEEMNMTNEQMEKELERALEHYKQLHFQEKLKDAIEKANELSEKQKGLGEKMENKDISKEDAKQEQKKIDDLKEQLKEDIKKLDDINKELENKHNMEKAQEDMNAMEKSQEDSKEQLKDNKMKKSGKSQKQAGDQSEKLSQSLQMQMSSQSQQNEEDMDALRQLLENLIEMSFTQEEIMDNISGLSKHDPMYFEVGRKQRKLKDDAEIIEDSLFALSKRVIEIAPIVNKEIGQINYYMEKTLDDIGERRTAPAQSKQRYIMTSTNNLALLLDEALKQMQNNMQSQMSGSGSCSKPGGKGKPKPSSGPPSMQEMQDRLAKQLEQMKKGMQPGKGKGEKPGQGGMPGMGGKSEQLAKMAAEQAAIREKMKQMRNKLNEDGSGQGNGLNKMIDDIEKTEEDIIFDRISEQTIHRQQDIMTRLLEHERAQRERDWDEKRESKEAKNDEFSNPERYLEYKIRKQKELELLRTIPPDLRKYYKNKVNAYFNNVE